MSFFLRYNVIQFAYCYLFAAIISHSTFCVRLKWSSFCARVQNYFQYSTFHSIQQTASMNNYYMCGIYWIFLLKVCEQRESNKFRLTRSENLRHFIVHTDQQDIGDSKQQQQQQKCRSINVINLWEHLSSIGYLLWFCCVNNRPTFKRSRKVSQFH